VLEDNLSVNIARRFWGVGAGGGVAGAPSSEGARGYSSVKLPLGGSGSGEREEAVAVSWERRAAMLLSSSSPLRALRHFTVLALESSADDSCAAVVTSSGQILSNVVLKQNHVYGHHSTLFSPT